MQGMRQGGWRGVTRGLEGVRMAVTLTSNPVIAAQCHFLHCWIEGVREGEVEGDGWHLGQLSVESSPHQHRYRHQYLLRMITSIHMCISRSMPMDMPCPPIPRWSCWWTDYGTHPLLR